MVGSGAVVLTIVVVEDDGGGGGSSGVREVGGLTADVQEATDNARTTMVDRRAAGAARLEGIRRDPNPEPLTASRRGRRGPGRK